ncbi:MAG: tripartite tricarboxylate transporter substrate binding protein [Burkholderiaceae bacterium]
MDLLQLAIDRIPRRYVVRSTPAPRWRSRLSAFAAAMLAATPLAATPLLAVAQAWPQQAIRVIVPFTPAGGTDTLARLLSDRLAADNNWTLVVENRAGAGGNIGMEVVARAKPDGQTLAVGQTSNLAVNPTLFAKMPYDSPRDFTPIAFVAQQPLIVVVREDAPYRTLAELFAAAKAKPGALNMASAATGTVGHLAGELLARTAGFRITHIPYKGAAPALADLIGGTVDFMLPSPPSVIPFIKQNRVRPLAVTSRDRLALLPDVPTIAESGFPGFEAVDWKVLVGPAGIPADRVRILHDAVIRAVGNPDFKARLAAEGSVPMSGSSEALGQFIAAEVPRWGAVVKESGAKAE